jgi:hypothetical protein
MSRIALTLLLIFSVANAIIVGPTVYEQDDFGDILWNEFTYSLSVDCDDAVLNVIVMNESIRPVGEAGTYLKYVDYASPLVSSGTTDNQGRISHKLPGNVSLMRGLFILVIEKGGYRTKEIHFDILKCLGNQTEITAPPTQPPPPPPQQPAEKIKTEPVQNETDTANPTTTANETGETEMDGMEELGYSGLLIVVFLVLLLIFLKRKQPK